MGVKGAEGGNGQRRSLFSGQAFVKKTHGVVVDAFTNVKANPFGIEGGQLTLVCVLREQDGARGGKDKEEDEHTCSEAVGNSSHGLALGSCPLSVRSACLNSAQSTGQKCRSALSMKISCDQSPT